MKIRTAMKILFLEKKYLIISMILFLGVVLCFSYTKITPTAPFYPINGTYQNYNVVRRLLDGQLPYKDFTVYLGIGHLYIGSVFTYLFGNNHTASVVAFSFLTLLSFSMISFTLGCARGKKFEFNLFISSLILILLVLRPALLTNVLGIDQSFVDSWNIAIDMGGSARTLRSLILPIAVYIYFMLIETKKLNESVKTFLIGVLIACSLAFSNDYGIATAIVLFIVRGFHIIVDGQSGSKKKILLVMSLVLGSIIGLLLIIRFTTGVSFLEWIEKQRGISSYQSWYYNQHKAYYIYEVRKDFFTNIQGIIALYGLIKILQRKSNKKIEIIAIVNFAAWLVIQEAELLGGGSIEVARNILWLTIIWWLIDIIELIWKNRSVGIENIFRSVAIVSCLAFIIYICLTSFVLTISSDNLETDVTNLLGGNITEYEEDVEEAAKFVDGKVLFSTYASAVEDVCNIYQPSGYDYIIHVLGDEARGEYLDSLHEADVDYVSVQRVNGNNWEHWIRNANWFFYREIYRWYKPVFHTGYEMFYAKSEEDQLLVLPEASQLLIERQEDGSVIIKIETDENIIGVADVLIDYSVVKKGESNRSKLIFRTDVLVEETTENLYYNKSEDDSLRNIWLPSEGKKEIPITIVNGVGEIQIFSNPAEDTELQLNNVSCNGYYDAPGCYYGYKGMKWGGIEIERDAESSYLLNRSLQWVKIGDDKYRIQYFGEIEDSILIFVKEKIDDVPTVEECKYVRVY